MEEAIQSYLKRPCHGGGYMLYREEHRASYKTNRSNSIVICFITVLVGRGWQWRRQLWRRQQLCYGPGYGRGPSMGEHRAHQLVIMSLNTGVLTVPI